ncbi:MAG: AAA family ATPase [Bacteroidota bacterium]
MSERAEAVQGTIERLTSLRAQIGRVIVGQEEAVDLVLLALLCEGHVLLEGVPGLGKTMLVRTLGDCLALSFARIQFTPDLMPADILGTGIVEQNERGGFDLRFEPGPIFAHLVLADEINRASPKTQAALLEAMQEQAVTVRGVRHALPRPFQVLATQNPLEMEGTYPLPEAQIDRFLFKVLISHPSEEELMTILDRTLGPSIPRGERVMTGQEICALQQAVREVVVPPHVASFAVHLIYATQPDHPSAPEGIRRFVRYGSGPRGAQALILAGKARALTCGRYHLSLDDVRQLAAPALRHRVALNFDGLSEGVRVDDLLREVVEKVPAEKERAAVLGG